MVTAVDFGATRSDGNTVYARRDGQVLTVEREIVDELSKEAEPFRSTALVAFDRGDVAGGRCPVRRRVLRPAQEARRLVRGRPAGPRRVGGRRSAGARGPQEPERSSTRRSAKALDPATATVAIKNKGQKVPAWTIAFHPRATDMVARVSGRPGGFAVRKDVVEDLQNVVREGRLAADAGADQETLSAQRETLDAGGAEGPPVSSCAGR